MRVRATQFAGEWYPAEPRRLTALLDRKFTESERRVPALPTASIGFVVPHAGIEYSGAVAAAAYRSLRARPPNRLVLLGFSHFRAHEGIVAPEIDSYRTPLGDVPVDHEACSRFARFDNSVVDHSLEIQLPFLRYAIPEVPVVPLYIGFNACIPDVQLPDDCVCIASSDFTHYGRSFRYTPFPLDERTPDRIRALDFAIIDATGTLNRELFYDRLRQQGSTMCGFSPVGALLDVLRSAGRRIQQEVLDYQPSGELTGDWSLSVSYACLGYVLNDTQ